MVQILHSSAPTANCCTTAPYCINAGSCKYKAQRRPAPRLTPNSTKPPRFHRAPPPPPPGGGEGGVSPRLCRFALGFFSHHTAIRLRPFTFTATTPLPPAGERGHSTHQPGGGGRGDSTPNNLRANNLLKTGATGIRILFWSTARQF